MRSSPPALKIFVARGLLALAFLFAQQTAALHWLSHAVEATQAKASSSTGGALHHCDDCLAVAALGAAAPSAGFAFPAALARLMPGVATPVAASPAVPRLGFRSRAPPILS
jgi:hypothetical protein